MGANAQTSVPLFVANSVLTAAQQNISAATGVPVFATTVTRDAAFGGSNKVLAEGQLCYLESTDIVQYYTGAAWATVGPATSGALVRVGGGALSSTSTTFSNVFSATYDNYFFSISNLTSSSAGTITMIFGATATGYTWVSNRVTVSGGAANNATGSATTSFRMSGSVDTNPVALTGYFMNPFLAARTVYTSQDLTLLTDLGNNNGVLANTTSYTAFTISTSAGNLGGTMNIYGLALS